MNRQKILIVILFVVLFISNIFFTYKYFCDKSLVRKMEEKEKIDNNILSFMQLFVSKILSGEKEISFEDRLNLENSIRSLEDDQILDLWKKFTEAKNQEETQASFYKLFSLLLDKIKKS